MTKKQLIELTDIIIASTPQDRSSQGTFSREMIEALEAVLDCYGDSDSLIMMQCRAALDRARRNP